MSTAPEPYMRVGQLYRLRGLSRNKQQKYLAVAKGYGKTDYYLCGCTAAGWPGSAKRRYTDGDLFLCVKVLVRETEGWGAGTIHGYLVVTPDGRRVHLDHDGNKMKFGRVK